MAELYIVGQAPARTGDGRPFTGNSGKTLLRLFGWPSYEYMASRVHLLNLLDNKQELLPGGRGDRFDYPAAKREAVRLRGHWLIFYPETHVICCGVKVFKCFTGQSPQQPFKGLALTHRRFNTVLKCWYFPHPSGANPFYNSISNHLEAQKFLKMRLRDAARSPI
jgi:uracil-DNA glycosylase